MYPPSHLILSWVVGHRLPERRDRRIVAWTGLSPDLDGLSLLAGVDAYGRWHHVVMHNIVAAVLMTVVVAAFARDRVKVAVLAFFAFHIHLLTDFFGSGILWGIAYFWPLSTFEYFAPYRWELESWPNVTLTAVALMFCMRTAVVQGRTFGESFLPAWADEEVAATLRRRFSWLRRESAPSETVGTR